jgi:hypothetical protein
LVKQVAKESSFVQLGHGVQSRPLYPSAQTSHRTVRLYVVLTLQLTLVTLVMDDHGGNGFMSMVLAHVVFQPSLQVCVITPVAVKSHGAWYPG